jgi:hypothetical protein
MRSIPFLPKSFRSLVPTLLVCGFAGPVLAASAPLSLHPENAHYFLFRGKPAIVITSGEHYGSVLNLDFDYAKYLRTLESDGLNGTRTWAGAYCEQAGAFKISDNTLAPASGRFICPWARSSEPGYANGGNKFDLNSWDDAYFKRLHDFVKQAGQRGIIVELNLFCPFYEESMWRLSPLNVLNNINEVGKVARTNVYTLDKNGGLLAIQEAMVRKLVIELKGYDNLYYEICNEPYFGGVTIEWQHHVADVIVETEKALGTRHLISQNIANNKARVDQPHPAVSIFNFHYASPPETVSMNYGLNKVIGDNETGFRGTNDAPYRMEAWDFIIAGGGLFNHLDYSFTAGHEDGTFLFPSSQPGGGTPALRRQLRFLSELITKADFLHMHPANDLIHGNLPSGPSARVLAKPGEDFIVYLRTPATAEPNGQCHHENFSDQQISFELTLPPGDFTVDWLDTRACSVLQQQRIAHEGGVRKFLAPAFQDDIVLHVRKQ